MKTAIRIIPVLAWLGSLTPAAGHQDWRLQLLEEEGVDRYGELCANGSPAVKLSEKRLMELVELPGQ